ncbi:MAG: mechanosensitive ion channel [Gammaproteobacteria bacterium]|nr:mechanosensitive ion channel [Gammaproteobacteria bacterium]
MLEQFQELQAQITAIVSLYGLKIVAALAIFIFGRWIARGLTRLLRRVLTARKADGMLVSFLGNICYFALVTFVIIAALSQLGIQTASMIAVLGAAGLAVGLALQGSLSNFAAGVLIVTFRPFKVGDYVEAAGISGTVEAMSIFSTILCTPDNKQITVPNAAVTGGTIVNYSHKPQRRIDMTFGIGYADDIDRAREVIREAIAAEHRILRDRDTLVAVAELADSSVNFYVRPWVNNSDYWPVYYALTEDIKKRFDAAGISIPFPQRDVHLYQATPS